MIERFTEFVVVKILLPILVLFALILIVSLPFAMYGMCKKASSPTLELTKNEWVCAHERTYTTTNMVMVGKVVVPQVMNHTECTTYVRKD